MKKGRLVCSIVVVAVILWGVTVQAQEKLMVFCGAAFTKPMGEIITAFTARTGVDVTVSYGAVGTLFSQILLTRQGDLFIAPSSFMMEQAQSKGLVKAGSVDSFAFVVPAINVQKGNPKGITSLRDLAHPWIRVAIANPEIVFTGMLAAEVIDTALGPEEKKSMKKNIVATPEDFNKLAMLLILKKVDAIIGFHHLDQWHPDRIETIKLKAGEIQRIGAGQVGILSHSKKSSLAERFKNFLASDESQAIFAKYHYFASPQKAFTWIGAKKPVGGEHPAASDWLTR